MSDQETNKELNEKLETLNRILIVAPAIANEVLDFAFKVFSKEIGKSPDEYFAEAAALDAETLELTKPK